MRKNLTKTAAILVMSAMVAASALTACGSKAEETTAAAEEAPAKAEEKPAAKAVAKQEVPVSDNTQIIAVITAAIAAQMEAETGVCVPADGLVIRSIKKRTFN